MRWYKYWKLMYQSQVPILHYYTESDGSFILNVLREDQFCCSSRQYCKYHPH